MVDSASGDLIMTAAHCITGHAAGMVFAPGYLDGAAPYGTWIVTSAYVPAAWSDDTDPDYDFVILSVTPASTNPTDAPVQAVVGGNRLGLAPTVGELVTVAGYAAGRDDAPVICSTTTYLTGRYPTFDCAGYVEGTSGSPWIADFDPATGQGMIVALIGGLHQGGCSPDTSYSAPFTADTAQLLQSAADEGLGDDLPLTPDDGC